MLPGFVMTATYAVEPATVDLITGRRAFDWERSAAMHMLLPLHNSTSQSPVA